MRMVTWCLALVLLVAGCGGGGTTSGGKMTPEQASITIAARTLETVQALRDKNWEKVAGLVHPERGVRFSPYAYVQLDKDRQFPADRMKNLPSEKALIEWGTHAGSGEPIMGTFMDYYGKFIYDVDFAAAPQVLYNQPRSRGNTINNIRQAYPDAIVVEYHYPGFDPKHGGLDWRSLYLTFESKGKAWYLTGVIHDSWTP